MNIPTWVQEAWLVDQWGRYFSLCCHSKLPLGATQLPIQWVMEAMVAILWIWWPASASR